MGKYNLTKEELEEAFNNLDTENDETEYTSYPEGDLWIVLSRDYWENSITIDVDAMSDYCLDSNPQKYIKVKYATLSRIPNTLYFKLTILFEDDKIEIYKYSQECYLLVGNDYKRVHYIGDMFEEIDLLTLDISTLDSFTPDTSLKYIR